MNIEGFSRQLKIKMRNLPQKRWYITFAAPRRGFLRSEEIRLFALKKVEKIREEVRKDSPFQKDKMLDAIYVNYKKEERQCCQKGV